jgi:hypothetical protein
MALGLGNLGDGYEFQRAYKAPGYGHRRGKAGPFVPSQAYVRGLGSNPDTSFRPSAYSAWNNQHAFADWAAAHPEAGYHWDQTKDLDGDKVNEGLVLDAQGNVVGINGYRLNRPQWAKNVNWKNAEGNIENMYEKRYASRKANNTETGFSTLKDVKKQLSKLVSDFMKETYAKGSAGKKVMPSSIAAFLIASPIGGNSAAIDKQWLDTYGAPMIAEGMPPSTALQGWYRDSRRRALIEQNITKGIAERNRQITAAIQEYVQAHRPR